MTKHTYTKGNITCVALLGTCEGQEAFEKLRGHKEVYYRIPIRYRTGGGTLLPDPQGGDVFHLKKSYNCSYFTLIDVNETEVLLVASFFGNLLSPDMIEMRALEISGRIDESALKQYLDDLLTATGIREIDSKREAFQLLFDGFEKSENPWRDYG